MKKGNLWKRMVAAMLSITLLLSVTWVDTSAAPSESAPTEADSHFTDTEPEIDSTNTVGNLIKNSLEAETKKEDESDGYDIVSLTVEGNAATVEYDTLEDGEIVVAIYEEGTEPLKMLASGKADAQKEEHMVEVTIDSGTMPQYFIAKAFLLSKASHSPLCSAFTSNLYTQEIQELQSKTTSDYDADRVLNLDENTDTNYAVYSQDTEVIEEQTGKNKVTDNKDGTYTITNADASFTGLKKGDVFSYNYEDGTVLVVKVSAIQVNGTTVVITEDTGADLSDAFDYVKIEETDDGTNATVDDSSLEDGVTYEGEESVNRSRAVDIGGEFSKKFSFKLAQEVNKIKITGSIGIAIKTKIKVYLSLNYQYIETNIELPLSLGISVSGKLDCKRNLCTFTITPVAGITIKIPLSLVFSINSKIDYKTEFTTGIGFVCDSKKGFVSTCSSPQMKNSDLSVEGSIYVGISLDPQIAVLSEKLANASLTAEAGFDIQGTMKGGEQTSDKIHQCKLCIEGNVTAKRKIGGKIKFMNTWSISADLTSSFKLCDFYYSIDHGKFAFTKCPYNSYKIVLKTLDSQKQPISNVKISDKNSGTLSTTNGQGEAIFYLPNGNYHLEAEGGEYTGNTDISVSGKSKTVKINMEKSGPTNGTCGKNLTWELDKNGTLYIRGTGKMDDYYHDEYSDYEKKAPWDMHIQKITNLIIENGVTSIGNEAFEYYEKLTNIQIPDTVTSIGDWAFHGCTEINAITIPDSVTHIGIAAFSDCSLDSFSIPTSITRINNGIFSGCNFSSVIIPDHITSIGAAAFSNCHNLTSISIPNSVTSIESNAFSDCDNLKSINLPPTITVIPSYLFNGCTKLTNIKIPNSVTKIEDRAFKDCGISNITIPNTVTEIEHEAFSGCLNLNSITIPNSVTRIDGWVFSDCTNLSNVTLSNKITEIMSCTFAYCTNLTNIIIPDSVTKIESGAFWNCKNLANITIPSKVVNIEYQAFENCQKLNTIHFLGDIPSIGECCFEYVTATVYYPANNSTWSEDKLLDYGGNLTWVASGSVRSASPANQPEDKHTEEYAPEKSDTQSEQPQQKTKTATSIPTEYYTSPQPSSLQSAVYTTDTRGSYTASVQELVPQSEYLLAVVKDENAAELLASDNLLYIDQKASDETGAITLPYHPRDDASGSELFFGPGAEKTLKEFIAKILAAQSDDVVKAEDGAFTTLPSEALNAASSQQVYLELPAGNDISWVIDGKSIPADTAQDVGLEIIRTGKQGGQIPEDTISKIAGNYRVEQLNLPQAFQSLNIDTSLKIKTDSAFAGWKCLTFQYTNDGQSTLTEKTLIQNGEAYINSIQGENYLLVYGKNGDVNCDENVNMADLMKILYHVSGRSSLGSLEQSLSDVNLDNNVNMTDLMKVLYYISGRNTTL